MFFDHCSFFSFFPSLFSFSEFDDLFDFLLKNWGRKFFRPFFTRSINFPRMSTEEQNAAAATETMDTTEAVVAPAGDEDDRKLFVGGLPQDAKDAEIKEHFSQFGEIEGINLKTDPHTGRSRGFAFVVFKEQEALDKAVTAEHTLKNKKVAVKKAQAKQGKVYVGKLKPEVTDDDVKEFFAQYGAISGIEQPFDKIKNERKNFCFITFEKEEPAKKLLKEGSVSIKGFELEIKKVTPKPDPRMGGGFAGRGGGRGGGPGAPWGGHGGYPGGAAGGQWGGYGDYWGGYGGYGADPYYGNWGGYGGAAQGGWGGYQGAGGYGGAAGGKTPRGRGAPRGQRGAPGAARGGQRQKPY